VDKLADITSVLGFSIQISLLIIFVELVTGIILVAMKKNIIIKIIPFLVNPSLNFFLPLLNTFRY
jgi:hypothetical protein